ncbi:F-type H+-transporting ATPase subunit epsilon [Clostridium tetanomorphum]|uniref:ATP synthase F1 complex delta/epsilon subunit N-terminal domain-containing protein n=1 Tax=Clostridium tetanomorphum TaxID=1553 RepID=A0A923EDR8_CLOTT|nr:hypothetical protein [Clostridium tetanomorphum]KAJ48768.1 F0F1 ATP synthase subunit epsilon [Clostridium tetanomorphum DSM 665]KAJ53254.1 F0F1 ATP synthase subunit epsilon [Clostridium tetanomorphum DSM 665]MBC2399374.1 hypothetical protein [Clostridium tetanomorphum]MBP1865714.1 F-type H+-transporting ATPase subunit epsilon [Clostridium tetanomorphum]NRS86834.1 F-type H+-transporting ATPase subunit epsilon [Clostridium tetanomorphum]
MENSIKLIVSTPFKEHYNIDIKKIITESITGRIEILPKHSPLIAILKPALTEFEDINGEKHSFRSSKGLMEVTNNEVTIVCNNIENSN